MFSFQQYSKQSHSKPKYPITYYKKENLSNLSSTSLHLDFSSLYNNTNINTKQTSSLSKTKTKPTHLKRELNMSHLPTETYIHLTTTSPIHKGRSKVTKTKNNSISNGISGNNSQKKFQVLAGAKPKVVVKSSLKEIGIKKGNAHRTCKTLSMANLSFNNGKGNTNTIQDTKVKIEKNIRYNMLTTIKSDNKEPFKIAQQIMNTTGNKMNVDNKSVYSQLESNLDSVMKDIDNKPKKIHYNIIKQHCKEFIQICPNEQCGVLNKLFNGYNKLIAKFSAENKMLYEKGIEKHNKLNKVNKYLSKCMKQLQDKEKEIEELKNIIKNMSFGTAQSFSLKSTNNMSKDSNSTAGINSLSNENNNNNNQQLQLLQMQQIQSNKAISDDNDDVKRIKSHKKVIEEFNKQNYKDLDALYFIDKVEMDSKDKMNICGIGVPNLKIESEVSGGDDEEESEEDYTNSQMYIEDGMYNDEEEEIEEQEEE